MRSWYDPSWIKHTVKWTFEKIFGFVCLSFMTTLKKFKKPSQTEETKHFHSSPKFTMVALLNRGRMHSSNISIFFPAPLLNTGQQLWFWSTAVLKKQFGRTREKQNNVFAFFKNTNSYARNSTWIMLCFLKFFPCLIFQKLFHFKIRWGYLQKSRFWDLRSENDFKRTFAA